MTPPAYDPETAIPTSRYKKWHQKQSQEKRRQIVKVLTNKVGVVNSPQVRWLADALWELKPNSYRIYFGAIGEIIYLLDGGTKRLQKKQIPEMMKLWNAEKKQAQLPNG